MNTNRRIGNMSRSLVLLLGPIATLATDHKYLIITMKPWTIGLHNLFKFYVLS